MPTKSSIILILLILSTGCSTTPHALTRVQKGMDKAEVLELAGSPTRSYRKNSIDHWVYTYYVGETPNSRLVRFKNSKVISQRPLERGRSAASEQEFKEYTQGLKQKRQSQQGFQELDD